MKRGGKRRREKGKINSLIMSFFIYLFFMFFLEMHAINHFYFVYLKIFTFMWMETIDHIGYGNAC